MGVVWCIMGNKINSFCYELFFGEKGSGKSLSMVAITHEDLRKYQCEMDIYSNIDLKPSFFKGLKITKEKNFHRIEKKDLEIFYKNKFEFKNSIFLIDEFHVWLDSRNFGKDYHKSFFYFVGQLRKRGNVLRGTTHFKNLIDLRGRLYLESEYYCYLGLVDSKNKWKQILNYNRTFTKEEQERMYVKVQVYIKKMIKTNFLPEYEYINYQDNWIKAKDYFDMYDTEEYIV